MRTLLSVFVLSCLLSTGAHASGFDLSLSNETANLEFLAPAVTVVASYSLPARCLLAFSIMILTT